MNCACISTCCRPAGYCQIPDCRAGSTGSTSGQRFVALQKHQRNWLEAIRTRRRPSCDLAVGCRSTVVAHLGCIARWTGRALKWDPAAEQFLGDEEANRMLGRAMRPPWHV